MIERLWFLASVLFLVVAGFFLWRNNLSAAFVTGTLGAVAWFLSYRARLRATFATDSHNSREGDNSEAD